MFIEVLFIIAKFLSIREYTSKIHSMRYFPENNVLIHAPIWLKYKNHYVEQRRQAQKSIKGMILFIRFLRTSKTTQKKLEQWSNGYLKWWMWVAIDYKGT